MSCLPQAKLPFCDPAELDLRLVLLSQGSLMPTESCKGSQPEDGPPDRFLFLFIANSFVKKIKPLSRNTGTGAGRYWPGADGCPERLRLSPLRGYCPPLLIRNAKSGALGVVTFLGPD